MIYQTKEEALHGFWSSFGWAAYDENSVPDDATLPYITYEVETDNIGSPLFITGALRDRATNWRSVTQKKDEIARSLEYGGLTLRYTDGLLFVTMGTPFAQRMAGEEDNIRMVTINIAAEFMSAV